MVPQTGMDSIAATPTVPANAQSGYSSGGQQPMVNPYSNSSPGSLPVGNRTNSYPVTQASANVQLAGMTGVATPQPTEVQPSGGSTSAHPSKTATASAAESGNPSTELVQTQFQSQAPGLPVPAAPMPAEEMRPSTSTEVSALPKSQGSLLQIPGLAGEDSPHSALTPTPQNVEEFPGPEELIPGGSESAVPPMILNPSSPSPSGANSAPAIPPQELTITETPPNVDPPVRLTDAPACLVRATFHIFAFGRRSPIPRRRGRPD